MLKRFILWDYPRGSRPYDVIVGIILAFIFLTPRDWFRDQPRIPKASSIAMLPSEHEGSAFFVDAALLSKTPDNQRMGKLTELLHSRMSNRRPAATPVRSIRSSRCAM